MKNTRLVLFALFSCLACQQTTSPQTALNEEPIIVEESVALDDHNDSQESPIVYVTPDGDKYHTADCRYSKTALPIKLSKAKSDGLTACSVCKPNSTTGEGQLRCSGTTAEGKQCQRLTSDASGKCFQHRDAE